MAQLRTIDVTKILAISTDDFREDEVYHISFVNCGSGETSGESPGSYVPLTTQTVTHQSGTITCPQGVEVAPYTVWGRLFPVHPSHESCCQGGRPGEVSGPVFFFDSDSGPSAFLRIFGVIIVIMISVAIAAGVGLALLANPPLAIFGGWGAGMVSGGVLALLWARFVDAVSQDDYLGGVRVSFPCQSGAPRIERTVDLEGANMGIRSNTTSGRKPAKWDRSSARYRVTFLAQYT